MVFIIRSSPHGAACNACSVPFVSDWPRWPRRFCL